MKTEIYEFIVPDWSLCYLVNGDTEGLSEDELNKVKKFEDTLMDLCGHTSISIQNEEAYFSWRNDIDGNLGASCYDCTITKM